MSEKGIRDYNCRIISVEDHPHRLAKKRVIIEVDDGRGPKYQKTILVPKISPTDITIEMFSEMLASYDLSRPKSPMRPLEQAVKDQTVFKVEQESV